MAASQAQINALRLCISVPEERQADFTDDLLAGFLEAFPVKDADGLKPADTNWTPTYDRNAAAAELWELIADATALLYDLNADGTTLQRTQMHEHALRRARSYRSRRRATSRTIERSRQRDILLQGRWPYCGTSDLNDYQDAMREAYPSDTSEGTPL